MLASKWSTTRSLPDKHEICTLINLFSFLLLACYYKVSVETQELSQCIQVVTLSDCNLGKTLIGITWYHLKITVHKAHLPDSQFPLYQTRIWTHHFLKLSKVILSVQPGETRLTAVRACIYPIHVVCVLLPEMLLRKLTECAINTSPGSQ